MNDKLDIPRLMELAERGSGKFGQDVANAVTELLSARERIAELERDYAKCILSKGRKPDSADVVDLTSGAQETLDALDEAAAFFRKEAAYECENMGSGGSTIALGRWKRFYHAIESIAHDIRHPDLARGTHNER